MTSTRLQWESDWVVSHYIRKAKISVERSVESSLRHTEDGSDSSQCNNNNKPNTLLKLCVVSSFNMSPMWCEGKNKGIVII